MRWAVSRLRKIAAELAVFDDVGALRGDAFVVVGKSAKAGAVFEAGVGDNVDDIGAVAELVELIERQKTCAGEIGFLAENAIEFDRMADGFVNLQAELASAKDERSGFLGALRGGMKRDGFFGNARRVLQKFERLDKFVAFERMLAAETVRVGALLNFVALEGSGGDAAASDHFSLMNAGADAGGKPGIDFAKLHAGFGECDTFDAAHFGIGCEQQSELVFQRNFERVFAKRALPTVDVGVFFHHQLRRASQARKLWR